jgi:hypothetical protein
MFPEGYLTPFIEIPHPPQPGALFVIVTTVHCWSFCFMQPIDASIRKNNIVNSRCRPRL